MPSKGTVPLRVSDFDFASVSRWLSWFSEVAGLSDLDVGGFRSFRVTKSGFEGLKRKKEGQLASIESNMKKIERWVEDREGKIEETELVPLRSMYTQYLDVAKVVGGHIRVAANLAERARVDEREREARLREMSGEGQGGGDGNDAEGEWPF